MSEELAAELVSVPTAGTPWAQVETLRDILATGQQGVALADGAVQVFLLGRDHTLEQIDLEQYGATPRRKSGAVTFADVRSFVGYVDAHNEEDATTLYRLRDQAKVLAVLNGPGRGTPRAGWSDHRAWLELEPSVEWKAWSGISGKFMSQLEFASFLEDHARDVRQPDAATLIELARTIEGAQQAEFGSSIRLDNGARAFTYRETIAAKAGQDGRLEIPGSLELALRPFAASPQPFVVQARFKYRLQQGNLLLGVELDRPDLVLETVLAELDGQIGDETGFPVWVVRALP